MSLDIEYRDASYRPGSYGAGKKVRRVEAICGQVRAYGENRTEAKAALLDAIQRQCEHAYTRRYLTGPGVTFVLSYSNGWQYDIVRHNGAGGGSTGFDAATEHEAFERMRRHFEQFTECAAV